MAVLKALASTVKPVSTVYCWHESADHFLHQRIDWFFLHVHAILMQDSFFFLLQAAHLPNPEFIEDIHLLPRSKAMQVC